MSKPRTWINIYVSVESTDGLMAHEYDFQIELSKDPNFQLTKFKTLTRKNKSQKLWDLDKIRNLNAKGRKTVEIPDEVRAELQKILSLDLGVLLQTI